MRCNLAQAEKRKWIDCNSITNIKNPTIMTATTQFETGNVYEMTFIGDSNLRPQWICINRTAKTVTFERFKGTESMTRRIKEWDGCEYILDGSYSMAPQIKATRLVA